MSKNNYPYEKSEGTREVKSVAALKANELLEEQLLNVAKKVSENYQKTEKDLDSALFIIISGGEQREFLYFRTLLNNPSKFPRIKIHFVTKEKEGLETLALLDTANKLNEHLQDSIYYSTDSFFLISDRDHFYTQITAIKPECDEKGYYLIINNPCIELWLYYSYYNVYPTDNGFVHPEDIKQLSSDFKTYLHAISASTGGIDPRKAFYKIDEASGNAKMYYKEDEQGVPAILSSNMFILAEKLIPMIEPEMSKLIQEEQEKAERFRNDLDNL